MQGGGGRILLKWIERYRIYIVLKWKIQVQFKLLIEYYVVLVEQQQQQQQLQQETQRNTEKHRK